MSAERRRHGPSRWGSYARFVLLFTLVTAGCGDDPPECSQPVLTNEQEAALVHATLATTEGMVATAQHHLPGEIVDIASDYQGEHDDLVDPDPCSDRSEVLLEYPLVVADLVAHSETFSPELEAGLIRATREGGALSLLTFLNRSDYYLRSDYPGLGDMRDRLHEQKLRTYDVFERLQERSE